MGLIRKALFNVAPAAALVLGTAAFASPAMAVSAPLATVPSTIAVNTPFTVTVSNVPSGTQIVNLVLDGMDQQVTGHFITSVSVPSGQTSVTLSGTIPNTMNNQGTTITTAGGPRELEVEFFNSSYAFTGSPLLDTVNITGVRNGDHYRYDCGWEL
jgi:hypothetical protein